MLPSVPVVKIGLAIWPKKSAEWVELAMSNLPNATTEWIGPEQVQNLQQFTLLIVDGDSPGPSFMAYYKSLAAQNYTPQIVLLGTPMSPVLKNLEWEPDHTVFVSKPYRMEDILKAVKSTLEKAHPKPTALPSPLEQTGSEPKALGYLSTLRLSDLIQMLCLSHWTGKIEVMELADKKFGQIYVNTGVLVHAEFDHFEAEEACYRMLSWQRCEFHFVERHPPVVQTITSHWQNIMLEGARRLDEAAHG